MNKEIKVWMKFKSLRKRSDHNDLYKWKKYRKF